MGKWHYIYSDCLPFHQWREVLEGGFAYVAKTYSEVAKCSVPLLGSFSSSVEKENNWPLMLWLSWWSSLQFSLRFLPVHCFGGSPGAGYMLSPRWSQKVQNSAELKGGSSPCVTKCLLWWQFLFCCVTDPLRSTQSSGLLWRDNSSHQVWRCQWQLSPRALMWAHER